VATRRAAGASLEPLITKLQLELGIGRRAAEALAGAGYRSAAEVAAADDAEFHAAVSLPAADRAAVLEKARAPGSKAAHAGPRPVLASERRPAGKVLAAARPVGERIVRLVGEPEAAPPPRLAAKAEPPRGEAPERRRRRQEADEVEAELDERLRGDR
jgi:hypothetical protein